MEPLYCCFTVEKYVAYLRKRLGRHFKHCWSSDVGFTVLNILTSLMLNSGIELKFFNTVWAIQPCNDNGYIYASYQMITQKSSLLLPKLLSVIYKVKGVPTWNHPITTKNAEYKKKG